MSSRIAIIQGHPDPDPMHFGHALAEAYRQGAEQGGHQVQVIQVAQLEFPLLRTKADWERQAPPPDIAQAQQVVAWADQLVIFYPLWLGTMPALLKGFLEQLLRPGFAIAATGNAASPWGKLLTGKRARVVITMGMPGVIYRWYFGAHSLKSLERNILGFVGIKPIKASLVGLVENTDAAGRAKWLDKMTLLGRAAD